MEKGTGADRSQLVGELTQIEEIARQLEAHLDQPNSLIEFCKQAAPKLLSSIKRSICMAKSTNPGDGRRRPDSGSDSPRSASGSPRGELNSEPAFKDQERKEMTKRRKTLPKWTSQVSVCPGAGGVEGPLDDGYSWRKYGQKDILGAKYPRGYYRCTHRNTQGCPATKQVQRSDESPFVFDVTYNGHHTCLHRAQSIPKSGAQDCDHPGPGLKAEAQGVDSEAQDQSSPSFFSWKPSTTPENGYAGCLSPTFRSPATSESNYLSVSPCRMGSYGGGFNIQTPESDLTEIISATTSATNSPLMDMDFMLEPLELDLGFPFDAASFFS